MLPESNAPVVFARAGMFTECNMSPQGSRHQENLHSQVSDPELRMDKTASTSHPIPMGCEVLECQSFA